MLMLSLVGIIWELRICWLLLDRVWVIEDQCVLWLDSGHILNIGS